MPQKKFYITTTLPYVNAEPHIGFALEIVQADVIARYHASLGDEVVFNTGTDEHGTKIYRKALEQTKETQTYVDEYAAKFDRLKSALNLSYTNFIRTSDPAHKAAAQAFWKLCLANDDIYKKNYQVKYCVGCELEKTESDLTDDRCPIHPNLELELIDEENYFFRFSKYQDKLLELYTKNPAFVVPDHRLTEIKNFVAAGLQDFSVSRLKSKMPWGVEVPDDAEHVMYVWFDALVNYISTLGWPDDEAKFKAFWPGVQIAGKDNLRQQSAMWQAMLMSAGLETSRQILIHGFINSSGQKMSKSLGNVIDPFELVEQYGTDTIRYYLLANTTFGEDSEFSLSQMIETYNADLANTIGNSLQRIYVLAAKNGLTKFAIAHQDLVTLINNHSAYKEAMDKYSFAEAVRYLHEYATQIDRDIAAEKPWEIKDTTKVAELLNDKANRLYELSYLLEPFVPEKMQKLRQTLENDLSEKPEILFPKIEEKK